MSAPTKRKYGNSVSTEFADLQTQIGQACPVAGNATAKRIPRIPTTTRRWDNWRQAHDECVSLQSQLQTLQEQTTQEQQRAAEAIAHFDAALKIASFDSRATFPGGVAGQETVTRLKKQQQTRWKSQLALNKRRR